MFWQDGEPCKVGVAMTDLSTGLYAHGAILAAVLQRQITGKGQHIDCNLFSTQVLIFSQSTGTCSWQLNLPQWIFFLLSDFSVGDPLIVKKNSVGQILVAGSKSLCDFSVGDLLIVKKNSVGQIWWAGASPCGQSKLQY